MPDGAGIPGGHPTRLVAFMNQKGGVGKTTTVVSLAAALAEAGRRVLVVDLDPQAHATLSFGAETDGDKPTIYDLLLDTDDPSRAVIEVRDNVSLIPSTVDLAAAEMDLADQSDRHARLAMALAPLREHFDFILFDCPPSLGLLTLNGLAAAREVVVPMQAHFLALQGVGKLLETIQLVGHGVNPSLRVSGVILCMHDENTRHTKEVVGDIEAFFDASKDRDVPWAGARVYRPAIRRNIKVAEAPSFGQTVFEYARTCAGAKDYQAIADEMIREWDAFLERQQRRSIDLPDADTSTDTEGEIVVRPVQPASIRASA